MANDQAGTTPLSQLSQATPQIDQASRASLSSGDEEPITANRFCPEFLRLEKSYLAKLAQLPALYSLLYRQYQKQLLAKLEQEMRGQDLAIVPPPWLSVAPDLGCLLALGILLAQSLADGNLQGEELNQPPSELLVHLGHLAHSAQAATTENQKSRINSLAGRLCFRLSELHFVLLGLAPLAEWQQHHSGHYQTTVQWLCDFPTLVAQSLPVLQAGSKLVGSAFFAGLSGFVLPDLDHIKASHQDPIDPMDPIATPQSLPNENNSGQLDYFWYWHDEELCFSLSRLGRLQLSLWQAVCARIDSSVGRNPSESDPDLAGFANLRQQTVFDQPQKLFQTLGSMLRPPQVLSQLSQPEPTQLPKHDLLQLCLEKLCRSHLLLISGGPGSGKTTLLSHLLQVLQQAEQDSGLAAEASLEPRPNFRKLEIALCAPTARAAQRMLQSLNHTNANWAVSGSHTELQALTLHKLLNLGWSGTELYRPAIWSNPNYRKADGLKLLKLDILVLDEASMLDSEMAWKLLSRLHPETRLILIGDPEQLPPIGQGAFWKDLLAGIKLDTTAQNQNQVASKGADCLIQLQGNHRSVAEIQELGQLILQGQSQEFCTRLQARCLDFPHGSDPKPEKAPIIAAILADNMAAIEWLQLPNPVGSSLPKHSDALASNPKLLNYLWQNWCPSQLLAMAGEGGSTGFAPLSAQNGKTLQQSCQKIAEYFQWMEDYSMLSPLQRSTSGAHSINQALLQYGWQNSQQKLLNTMGLWFFHGCPLQITRNNYQLGLYNGDRGFCMNFGSQFYGIFAAVNEVSQSKTEGQSQHLLGDYRLVPMIHLTDCEASFVQTIHKSQGSEYAKVCLLLPEPTLGPVQSPAFNPWSKPLLYTAITRAKQQLCFVGSVAAVNALTEALEQQSESFSLLTQLLQQGTLG